ncbi:hypothetical protein CDAR_451941 [Caerostris darwini]|uniref:Uncharacterized protein n=1 Tax=Caerostris darwini TaxID=1538125 RepID=A0AAV4WJ07_9ARAC|nr:hypothetical protein CDAR_451941 [Caerostris darwini]
MTRLWSSLVVLFLAMQGSFADPCDTTECINLEMNRDLDRVNWMPTTEEQLDTICPIFLYAFPFTLKGTFAGFESCDFDKCQEDDLAEGLSRVNFLPNEQQLRELCPKTLQQVACLVQEAESCTGKTVEELASIADPTFAKIITGARSLIQDICDENSQFRKDYLESRDCFRGFIRVGARHCNNRHTDGGYRFVA